MASDTKQPRISGLQEHAARELEKSRTKTRDGKVGFQPADRVEGGREFQNAAV
jgi:hypothetical protein